MQSSKEWQGETRKPSAAISAKKQIHVDIWQNQYNIVKLKNKIKYILKKRNRGKQQNGKDQRSL